MTDQLRLFTPALNGVVVSAHWRYPNGWHVSVRWVYEGESEYQCSSYDGLATDELPQLLEDSLAALLGRG